MKRALLILTGLAAAAFAQDDVVMKAMRDELARSMAQLRMENLDKPYFISYRVDDAVGGAVSAVLGQLTYSNFSHSRSLILQVRVGDYKLDNTNFFGPQSSGTSSRELPLDDDYGQIRREIWLATDAAYKQACASLAAKRSVLERRKTTQSLADFTLQAPVTLQGNPEKVAFKVADLENLARELSAVFQGSPEILSSGAEVRATNEWIRQVNSEGALFTEALPGPQVHVTARALAADGTALVDSFHVCGRTADVFRRDDLLARTRALLAGLKALRTAPVLDRYNGPVLFEDDAAAQVVAQVFAPAVTALRIPMTPDPQFETQVQQVVEQFGVSLADRVGARVLPDGFDVTDNGLIPEFQGVRLVGAHPVDSEAVPAREVKLVENGLLKALLATRTPTPQTSSSTGSSDFPGMAVPRSLFLTARSSKTSAQLRQELLRIAKQRGYGYGIVVRHIGEVGLNALLRMAMGRMSPDSAAVIAAFKVFEDGHEELVRAQIAPIAVAAFKDIQAGDKPGVYNISSSTFMGAMNAAGSPIAWSSYIVPSLLFEDVSLKAPSGPAPVPPVAPSPMAVRAN